MKNADAVAMADRLNRENSLRNYLVSLRLDLILNQSHPFLFFCLKESKAGLILCPLSLLSWLFDLESQYLTGFEKAYG